MKGTHIRTSWINRAHVYTCPQTATAQQCGVFKRPCSNYYAMSNELLTEQSTSILRLREVHKLLSAFENDGIEPVSGPGMANETSEEKNQSKDASTSDDEEELSEEEKYSAMTQWMYGCRANDKEMLKRWKTYFDFSDVILSESTKELLEKLKTKTIYEVLSATQYYKKAEGIQTNRIKDLLLRKIIEINYNRSILLNITKDGETLGFNIFNNQLAGDGTMMGSGGGLPQCHAHPLLAIFIQPHLKSLHNERMEFHVLCHGLRYEDKTIETWNSERDNVSMDNYKYFTQHLFDSNALKSILEQPILKPIRRICIWMLLYKHTVLLCWDEFRDSQMVRHAWNIYDNLPNTQVNLITLKSEFEAQLRNAIREKKCGKGEIICRGHTRLPFITLRSDLVCVSFMARCTLYLKMFEGATLGDGPFPDTDEQVLHHIRMMYAKFEMSMHKFARQMISRKRIILFHPDTDATFINVHSVKLITVSQEGARIDTYEYDGRINEWDDSFRSIHGVWSNESKHCCVQCPFHGAVNITNNGGEGKILML